MIDNWSHFIMLNMSKFYGLNIHKNIIKSIKMLFVHLTSEFNIIFFNEKECIKKGWGNKFFLFIENSFLISKVINIFSKYIIGRRIVRALIKYLEIKSDAIALKWLLEIYKKSKKVVSIFISSEKIEMILGDALNNYLDDQVTLLYFENLIDLISLNK